MTTTIFKKEKKNWKVSVISTSSDMITVRRYRESALGGRGDRVGGQKKK